MAYTTPLTLPTTAKVKQLTFGYRYADSQNTTMENLSTYTVVRPGSLLYADLEVECTYYDHPDMDLWLARMKGLRNTTWYSPKYTNRGTGAGTITITGVSGFHRDNITLGGGTGANCIVAGDFIQSGNQLIKVLETYSGSAQTVQIATALRSTPSPSDPIVFTNPKGVFQLQTGDQSWSVDADTKMYGYSLQLREAF